MSSSQRSIQERAFRLANTVGTDAHASPVADSKIAAEDLFPAALREAVIEQQFRRSYSLTVADGVVTLPDGIIQEQLKTASIDAGNDTPTSYEERYSEYLAASYDQLNYFTVRNNQLLFREASEEIAEWDGTLTLSVVALPDIPATITDTIAVPDNVAKRTSEILARMLRGE